MRALMTAAVYFGSFLTLGYAAKRLLDRWMDQHGEELGEVQDRGRDGGRRSDQFLLGIWRK